MARMIVLRSRSSLAANRCMAPAPRSKPSRRTYMATINATQTNQIVSTVPPLLSGRQALGRLQRLRLGLGTVLHLAYHQHDVEEAHDEVHPCKAYEREEHVARGDQRRDALRGPEEAVGEPGLAPELGREPPGGVRDKGEGYGEHQDPEHPARLVEPSPPQQKCRQDHDPYEERPQANHDVVAVVEERDIIRPVPLREGF